MSRWIEYHDICSAIDNQQDGTGMTYEALAHAMVEIQLAPSIDIVPCRECRRVREDGGHANCNGYLYCRKWKTLVDEDSYCSWGKGSDE